MLVIKLSSIFKDLWIFALMHLLAETSVLCRNSWLSQLDEDSWMMLLTQKLKFIFDYRLWKFIKPACASVDFYEYVGPWWNEKGSPALESQEYNSWFHFCVHFYPLLFFCSVSNVFLPYQPIHLYFPLLTSTITATQSWTVTACTVA